MTFLLSREAARGFGFLGAVAMSAALPTPAAALDVTVQPGFVPTETNENVGGGLSYLPDGDILALTVDYVNGPKLVRIDANADGIPVGGSKTLATFDSAAFGTFVQVAPGGTFALAGLSGGSSTIYRVDLATDAVTPYFTEDGNFDLTFIDDGHAYLSSNPGGFNPNIPNRISYVELSSTPVAKTVAEIANSPSGPVAANARGDLFYVSGTYTFPTPAGSSTLMKFSASNLADAVVTGVPLSVAHATDQVTLDGGYDIAYHRTVGSQGELFLSAITDVVVRIVEGESLAQQFLTVNDGAGSAAVTGLTFFDPFGVFDSTGPARSKLAGSVAKNFFADYSLVQLRTTTSDADGDKVIDSADLCAFDAMKSSPGSCGCGFPDTDANADQIFDCGVVTTLSNRSVPRFGPLVTGKGTVKLRLEKFGNRGTRYVVELIGPGRSNAKRVFETTSSAPTLKSLPKGVYRVRYRALLRNARGKIVRQSKRSSTESVTVN
ncbi:MAG: hypothetical protein IT290_04410 [Deltaproteobacteria bacterium]|nr:hypothetical protein [Deltaproteobacteria bacterium]